MLPAQPETQRCLLCHGLPAAQCHQIPSFLHWPAGHRGGPGYPEHSPCFLGMVSTNTTSCNTMEGTALDASWMPQKTRHSSSLEECGHTQPLWGLLHPTRAVPKGKTSEIPQKRDAPKSLRFPESFFPSQPEAGAPPPLPERESHARDNAKEPSQPGWQRQPRTVTNPPSPGSATEHRGQHLPQHRDGSVLAQGSTSTGLGTSRILPALPCSLQACG